LHRDKAYTALMLIPDYPDVKVLGFAGFSGSGKTTLLTRLIPLLSAQGLRIAIVKHSHHDFEIDQPGKDSYLLHHAGSRQTLLVSKHRSALIKEKPDQAEPGLLTALNELDLHHIDLVLVEGFRDVTELSRIEVHRPVIGKPLLCHEQKNFIALASDQPIETDLPLLDINEPQQVANFVLQWLQA